MIGPIVSQTSVKRRGETLSVGQTEGFKFVTILVAMDADLNWVKTAAHSMEKLYACSN